MSYNVIILDEWWRGFFYFLGFWAVHVLFWRYGNVRQNLFSLLSIFFFLPAGIYLLCVAAGIVAADWMAALLLHCLLSANYIAAYPAIAAQSPTVEILWLLHSDDKGMSRGEILKRTARENLLQDRFSELLTSGLVRESAAGMALTARGRCLARFFFHYRKFLGLPAGTG